MLGQHPPGTANVTGLYSKALRSEVVRRPGPRDPVQSCVDLGRVASTDPTVAEMVKILEPVWFSTLVGGGGGLYPAKTVTDQMRTTAAYLLGDSSHPQEP